MVSVVGVVGVAIIIMVMKSEINGDSNNHKQTEMKAKKRCRCWQRGSSPDTVR